MTFRFALNVCILCLNLYWQSKEMKDLIRPPTIKNGRTSSSIYPIMTEWWFYVVTRCLIMPNKPNWSNWRWPLFMFNVITDIHTLNFVVNNFLNTTNKYKNSITMNIMHQSVFSQRGGASGISWGLDSQNILAIGNYTEHFDTGAGP